MKFMIRGLRIMLVIVLVYGCRSHTSTIEVLVVGGGASGVTAGIQAARSGVQTMILEETPWLGGMLTAAGVSAVDGNHKLKGGLWREYFDALVDYYGSADSLSTGWVSHVLYEPSTGNRIWHDLAAKEPNLQVVKKAIVLKIERRQDSWLVVYRVDGTLHRVQARVIIDATELGDVAAAAGVTYDVGMDSSRTTGEPYAPDSANDVIQDLTYVMILRDYGVDKTIPMPEGYQAADFYCTCLSDSCTDPKPGQALWPKESMINYGRLPNGKYMINWPIEGNDFALNVIEMSRDERLEALEAAKNFSLCYLYYMQTELGFNTFYLDEEEFPTNDHFPLIPYHRESRRIHGLVQLTFNDLAQPYHQANPLYRTGIGVGDYPIDHHHKRNPRWSELPELHLAPIPSYSVPWGCLIPKEVNGLIVAEKSISVTNIVNGTTRLQPVVMQIGQAAGITAALAIRQNLEVSGVPVRQVQNELLEAGGYILPYLDIPTDSLFFKPVQRIGATGLLRGVGLNVKWENQTWFYVDAPLKVTELIIGMEQLEPSLKLEFSGSELSVKEAMGLVKAWRALLNLEILNASDAQVWSSLGLSNFNPGRAVTRGEFAVLVDHHVDPFNRYPVDVQGHFVR